MSTNDSYLRTIILKVGPVALIVFALYMCYNICRIIYNLYFSPLAKFPGPISRAAFHVGDYWSLYTGKQAYSAKGIHEEYGDVVRVRPDTLSFRTAQAWKDIYGIQPGKKQLQKDPRFYTLGGEERKRDIIYCSDADHARMRKLLSHAFSDSALRQQEAFMTKYFDLLVQRLKEKIDGTTSGKVDLVKWYNFLTFDIIGDLCFGESFNALENGIYHFWMSNILDGIKFARFLSIATFYQPALSIIHIIVKLFPSISKARTEHEQFTALKTKKRLDSKMDRKDFMDYILRYNDERGMSENEILNTSSLLILAGSETTSTLLAGATYFLLKNPHVYSKAKEEVRNAFAAAEDITLTSTAKLPYLHAVLEESLRMYPPVSLALPRITPPEGMVISGHFVPGNIIVGVSPFATNHSSTNFHDPETFDPDRWLPNPPVQYLNDNKDALNPFSIGPRNCIGKNLAYNEMRSVMTRMLWHFEMELLPGSENWIDQNVFFMWDKPDLNIKLSHRNFE